jgi:transglutaminase-like putative cysteine protease
MNDKPLSRTALLWQLLTVIAVTLPHLSHLPVWVPFLVLFTLSFRFMVYSGRWSFPKWWIKGLLVLLAGGSVLASYKAGGGISVTVALLIAGFGLKMLEINSRRDSTVVLYVAYIVLSTAFLFDQSVAMALYVIVVISIVTTALLSSHIDRDTSFLEPFNRCVVMLIPALPLMIVMFIGMPRLGPMWEVGLDKAAKTGLSDSMSPGDITQLTRSAEAAFSVRFISAPPAQSQLYWRSIVLNDFDGRRWFNQNGVLVSKRRSEPSPKTSGKLKYEMILEASQRKYVPVLDYLSKWPNDLIASKDGTLSTASPQTQRNQYQLTSRLDLPVSLSSFDENFSRELSLPKGNRKARELANRWWNEAGNYEGFIQKLERYFHDSFRYSLSPPPLGKNSVSDFLLDTQEGFCGHFASATAFMLRSVGIPARIVTGYQGGELNPYEEYYLIRQYDAHAWVEAWLPSKGWTRLDPTAWVAPERVEAPADEVLSNDTSFLKDSPFAAWGIVNNSAFAQLRLRIEAFNYGWHRWVLNYHQQQKGILEMLLGTYSVFNIAMFFLIPFILVITVTVFLMYWPKRSVDLNPANILINRLSKGLSRNGHLSGASEPSLEREQGETVSRYCARVSTMRPDLEVYLDQVSKLYVNHQYAVVVSVDEVNQLAKVVTQCLAAHRNVF